MGGTASGALNASGFTQSIKSKRLPHYSHITHNGIFNQNFFNVGEKTQKLLDIHQGVGISNCDLYDLPKRNYFLSLFLKSNTDGAKRTRPINVVVCLDISGSMNSLLKYHSNYLKKDPARTRLNLARSAILMLYDKLKQNDIFSLVVFHQKAKTIIKSAFKKDLNTQNVRQLVKQQFESGGTTIKQGFIEAVKNIKEFQLSNTLGPNYEQRIVMLTDVGDNSVANEEILIDQISNQDNINTTIIGISSDFVSQTCEKLIKVKGFNYFCAVQDQDLQTYLADRFDYNFFPCVQNVQIGIDSDLIDSIEVFGAVDSNKQYPKVGKKMTVTKMQTGFPSQLQTNKQGKIETQGGLILVKLKLKDQQKLPHIKLKVNLTYQNMQHKQFQEEYLIDKKLQVEQYYSDDAIEKGVRLFYYTQTMRNLLKDMIEGKDGKILSDENKFIYEEKVQKLKDYCPKQKLQQLNTIIDIVQHHNNLPLPNPIV